MGFIKKTMGMENVVVQDATGSTDEGTARAAPGELLARRIVYTRGSKSICTALHSCRPSLMDCPPVATAGKPIMVFTWAEVPTSA